MKIYSSRSADGVRETELAEKRNQMVPKTLHSNTSGNFSRKRVNGLQNCNREDCKY